MAVSKSQPMREAEIECIDAINSLSDKFPIKASDISTGTITGDKIGFATITTTNLANSCVTGAKIGASTITGSKIADKTISASKIADGSITATQLAANAVNANVIADGTITAEKLADGVIPSSLSPLDRYQYQAGTISCPAATVKTAVITFPSEYTTKPVGAFCYIAGSTEYCKISTSCTALSTTSVKVCLYNTSSASVTIGMGELYVFVIKE